jgi:protein ImuB
MQKRIIGGRVIRLAGPWRTSGEWWKPDGWVHEEWDVEIGEAGAVYRIYRDLRTDRWFVFGAYD